MKKNNNSINALAVFALPVIAGVWLATSCMSTNVSARSGAQLWGENCIRCHNTPSPADYNDKDWETIGLHMRVRANLTATETEKVIDFMKSAN